MYIDLYAFLDFFYWVIHICVLITPLDACKTLRKKYWA